MRLLVQLFYGRDKAIATAGQRFDKARALGRVPQGFADLVDGAVEPLVEVREAFRPKLFAQLLAGNDLAGMTDQVRQDLKRLLLQLHLEAALVEFPCSKIQSEGSKTDHPRRIRGRLHSGAPETTLQAV